jgi:hypothetical protein
MTISLRSHLIAGVATIAASAVVAAPSLAPPPLPQPVTSHTIGLATAVGPLRQQPKPDNIPTLADEVQRGIIPSLGAVFPAPPTPGPSPVTTDFASTIKNTYSAIEPWVRYGFEVATYAVGWVPYVGWLSGQIMIFYNFGERIVRSLVFNSADWLWGPLPFGQGVQNIAQDSWNALVQLGIDQWNFWLPPLPPLPPLPFATRQATTPAATLTPTRQQSGSPPTHAPQPLRAHFRQSDAGGTDATPHGLIADVDVDVEQALSTVRTQTAPTRTTVTEATKDATGTPGKPPNKAANVKALRPSAPPSNRLAKWSATQLWPRGKVTKTHNSLDNPARKKSTQE